MSAKEDLLNEIELMARGMGIEDELCRQLTGKITLLLNDYIVSEGTTALAVRESDEDVMMVRKFLMSRKLKGCTERTISFYTAELKRALPKFQKPLKEITVDDVRWFMADKEVNSGCSRVTCGNTLRTLSTFFQFLSEEEYIQGNPVRKFGAYKVPKRKKEAFTEYEIETMREAITNPKLKVVFEILLSTGCRVSELCQIKKSEIKGNEILVHGKGQKDRTVHMNVKAVKALEGYMEWKCQESLNSEWLFPKQEYKHTVVYPDEHMDKGSVEQAIRNLGRKVGVHAHPHKFRRTCATFALKRGMDLMYVSKMLGHDNLNTTQIYLDIDDETMKEQHKKYVI